MDAYIRSNRLEIMFGPPSQACEVACHYKQAIEDALEKGKKRIDLPKSLATTIRWPPSYSLALQDK